MNLEELEHTKIQRANRNTTSLFDGNVVCLVGSFNVLSPVQIISKTSASFVTPIADSQKFLGNNENFHVYCCEPVMERENSGFSIY